MAKKRETYIGNNKSSDGEQNRFFFPISFYLLIWNNHQLLCVLWPCMCFTVLLCNGFSLSFKCIIYIVRARIVYWTKFCWPFHASDEHSNPNAFKLRLWLCECLHIHYNPIKKHLCHPFYPLKIAKHKIDSMMVWPTIKSKTNVF